jgi:hypothetical protein
MAIERLESASYADIVDRILDKGIVIEAWVRLAVGGIDLMTIETHVIVASIDTYLERRPELDAAITMRKGLPLLGHK